MAIHESDRPKHFVLRWIIVFIIAIAAFALCSKIEDGVKRDPFRGVEDVFK